MRLYQLFDAILAKFVPMDVTSRNELLAEASKRYSLIKSEAELINNENQKNIDFNAANPDDAPKELKPLQMKHKIIMFLDEWWMRYIIAASFVWLVPQIKKIMTADVATSDDDGDDASEYEEFKAFQRFKQGF